MGIRGMWDPHFPFLLHSGDYIKLPAAEIRFVKRGVSRKRAVALAPQRTLQAMFFHSKNKGKPSWRLKDFMLVQNKDYQLILDNRKRIWTTMRPPIRPPLK